MRGCRRDAANYGSTSGLPHKALEALLLSQLGLFWNLAAVVVASEVGR
jgi:hypothetical protein